MTDKRNRRILLASRPHGEPTPENFKLVETEVERPGQGEMLLRHDLFIARSRICVAA